MVKWGDDILAPGHRQPACCVCGSQQVSAVLVFMDPADHSVLGTGGLPLCPSRDCRRKALSLSDRVAAYWDYEVLVRVIPIATLLLTDPDVAG